MGRLEKYEGVIQFIFAGLFIAAIGVLGGWWLSITTTLVLAFIGIIFIASWFWDMRHGGGGSGQLGVFFIVMPALILFILSLTIAGFIFHWDDLLYMLRGGVRI